MKRLFCLMMCVVMILTTAACGKEPEVESTLPSEAAPVTESTEAAETETTVPETTVPETTVPETTEPETTPAPVTTDQNAKPEDVLIAAAKALTAEDARFAFSADPVLDLSLLYEAPKQEEGENGNEMNMMQLIVEAIVEMLFDEDGRLNIRLEPKMAGFYEAGKGAEAEIEFKNNLADKVKALLMMMYDIESETDPSIAWIGDEIRTSLYVDLTEKLVYFLNPLSGAWNYTELNDVPQTKTEVPEKVDLHRLFEEYEWTVTNDQYILSGKVNAETMSEKAEAADKLPEDSVLRLTMVFNDEQKLVGAELVMDPFETDLSEKIQGLSIRLDQFTVKAEIDYDTPEFFGVPAEIAEKAEKFEGKIPFISDEDDEADPGAQY